MNGTITIEVELMPEVSGLGPRRSMKITVDGPVRGTFSLASPTPSNKEQIRSICTYGDHSIILVDCAETTAASWGFLPGKGYTTEAIYSSVTSTVDMSGRGAIDAADQGSDVLMGTPIAWFPSKMKQLYMASAPFYTDPYSVWFSGSGTRLKFGVFEFEPDLVSVDWETM